MIFLNMIILNIDELLEIQLTKPIYAYFKKYFEEYEFNIHLEKIF